ncbi:MAG: DUF4185 domain-containing protein, partial [Thermodesulfobacteriota bacterium]
MKIRRLLSVIFLSAVLFCPLSAEICADTMDQAAPSFRIEAQRWPEAEAIFHSDARWLGGDGASSVDLGNGRVLWMFGDSFVDTGRTGKREKSAFVRNTIAVQTGYDPASASMIFVWKTKTGQPAAFFDKSGATWYWPASGIALGKRLLVFLMEVRPADNALGFDASGWKAAWIENPQDAPERWRLTWLISPQHQGLVVGSGDPVLEGGFLQVFAADGNNRDVYLVRWPEAAARSGTLTAPQWWAGEQSGWVDAREKAARPKPVFKNGQMEFTVEYHSGLGRYLRVQTGDFLNPCLAFSTAPLPAGPWSAAACFFSPPEQGNPELLIYAGK